MSKTLMNIILTMFLAVSCSGDVLNVSEARLVIDGFIEDGGFPTVMVTTTLPVSTEFIGEDDINDCVVRWAKVTVRDGDHDVILTGMANKNYFPPYLYTTGELRGEAGKTYSLEVEYHNMKATAVTTIPEGATIDAIKVAQSSESDSQYFLEASFSRTSTMGGHCGFFVREGNTKQQYKPSYLGLVDDSAMESWNVYPPETDKWAEFNPYFTSGMTVDVKLYTMDDASFKYWKSFAENSTFAGNTLISNDGNIMSNISGGEGIWAGYGVDSKTVEVP